MLTHALRQQVELSDRSIYRLAKDSHIDYAQLRRFVHHRSGLSIDSCERLADALGLRLAVEHKHQNGENS